MRNRLFHRSAALLPLLLTTALLGCNRPAEEQKPPQSSAPGGPPSAATTGAPRYKVITNGISPFWDAMGKGLDAVKAEIHVDATWSAPNPAQHNEQVKVFKDAVSSRVDGIAVSPIEADALVALIDETVAAGIPVITFDSDAPKSKRLAYLGTNNYEAGKIAGEEAAKLLPNGGKLVAFVGNMGAQNARERYQGFQDAVKDKNITFLQAPFEDNKDKGRARKNVEDAITRYQGQVDGFVGLYSYNGPAIVAAVQAANMRDKLKIICFDGEPETLNNLSKGLVDITVVQKPYEFGRLSIKLLDAIKKNGGDVTKAIESLKPELDQLGMKVNGNTIDTGVEVITPANAEPFIQKLKERGLEST
jgi:ribose transport system substrate-binding protein